MAVKVGRGRAAGREEETEAEEERMANQSKSGECKSQEQRGSHPPGSWQAHMAACPYPPHGGECKGENKKGMRGRAQAGWGLTRVRPAGLAEDREQQTASAPAGP
jgi:hypothetical protein